MELSNRRGWLLVAVAALMFSTGCNDNTSADSSEPVVSLQGGIDTDVFPDNLHLVTDVILTAGQSMTFFLRKIGWMLAFWSGRNTMAGK